MSKRRSIGRGVGRQGKSNRSFNIESLEDRRLLSAVTFAAPITTALPSNFVPSKLLTVNAGDYDAFNEVVVTGANGGAVILIANNDGSYNTIGTIGASNTVIGATTGQNAQNNSELIVFTTTGAMVQQTNGSFSAPTGYTVPSDAVPGAATVADAFVSQLAQGPELTIERFVPDSGDPTTGSIVLTSYFQSNTTGLFTQHKDTTIATNVASPATEVFLGANLNGDNVGDVVANGNVWFGNQDGSFSIGPSLGLTTAEKTASLTTGTFLNSAGTLTNSLVLYPAPATNADPNSDAVQLFVNDGSGTFKRGQRVDLGAAGTTTGPVLVHDFNADTAPDIAVAVTSGTDSPGLAVISGTTFNGFTSRTVLPLPAGTNIVGINAVGNPVAFTSKLVGGVTKNFIEAIPNATVIVGPVITLSASSSSVFVGQRVVITANRTVPELGGAEYTLLDGSTVIGTSNEAADGSVTFAVSSLAAGAHVLTAVSTGQPDDVSAPLTLTVNADPPTGLVFATGIQAGLRAVEVPGDTETIKVSLRNIGGATATAPLNVKLFASATAILGDDAIPLPDPLLANVNPALGSNKTKTISAKLTMPDTLVPGTYFLIAQVGAAKDSGANQVIATTLVDFNSFQVAWQFGHVGNRQNVKFVQHLKSGVVTFALTGAGYGVVTPGDGPLTLANGGPDFEVNVAQTNIKSKLTISQTGSTKSNIVALTLNNDVGTVDVRTDTPHTIGAGPLDDNGVPLGTAVFSVKQLSIGTLPTAALVANANPSTSTVADINVNGTLGQLSATAIDNATIEVGAYSSAPTSMKIGTLGSAATITSQVPIAELDLTTAQPGSIIVAPSLGKLKTSGSFSAAMNLTGKTHGALVLGSIDIGGSVSGGPSNTNTRWAINGSIGDLKIRGSVANLELLAGARVGPLGELTTPLAAFSGVAIKSLTIGGSVTKSLLSAGLDPVDGLLLNGNDELLPGGSFSSISIGSTIDTSSEIVASSLPATVTVGRQKVSTAGDTRFKLGLNG